MNQDSNTQRRLELMRLIREERKIIITSSVSAQGKKKSFMEKAAVTAVRMNMATAQRGRIFLSGRRSTYVFLWPCGLLLQSCCSVFISSLPGAGPQHRRHYGRSDRDSGKCAGRDKAC